MLSYRMSPSQAETWRSLNTAAANALAEAIAQILITLIPDQVIIVMTDGGELAFAVDQVGGGW